MKKLLCGILLALLLLAFALPASAAGEARVKLTPSESTVARGERVTVTVSVSSCDPARSMGIIPIYDANVFELESGKWLLSGAMLADFSDGVGAIAFVDAADFNRKVFSFTLRVKADAAFGDYTIGCEIGIENLGVAINTAVTDASVSVVCDHRGATYTANGAEQHTFSCSACGKTERVAHAFRNACDPDCGDCGYERTVTHDYRSEWDVDGSGHYRACAVCGDRSDEAAHTPGPDATETQAQTCTVCGALLAPALGHTHKPSSDWSKDADSHWHACATCPEAFDLAAHEYDGKCDPDCNVCGAERAVSHTWSEAWVSDAATHRHGCADCDAVEGAAAHEWDGGRVEKEPTAEQNGERIHRCIVCAQEKTVELVLVLPETAPVSSGAVGSESDPATDDRTDAEAPAGSFSFPALLLGLVIGIALGAGGIWLLLRRKQQV